MLKLAWLAALGSLLTIIAHEFRKDKRLADLSSLGIRLSSFSLSLAVLIMARYLYVPNFDLDYVFSRSSLATPLAYRISALWAGQEGTFMLWSWVVALSALALSELKGSGGVYERCTQGVVLSGLLFFLGMTIASSPFDPTMVGIQDTAQKNNVGVSDVLAFYSSMGLYVDGIGFVDGLGMSPVLMSPWMALHPPLVFAAYGLLMITFAASAAYLLSGKGDWEGLSRWPSRFAWLFLTLGIFLGGFWAYEELSYGGYWSWDPVETSVLIPWLSLTAFVHGAVQYRKKKSFGVLAPFLGMFTMILVVYATFITRSGVLKSVHAYSGSAVGNFLVMGTAVAFGASCVLALRRLFGGQRRGKKRSDLVHQASYLAILFFFGLALFLAWGITKPVVDKILSGTEPPIDPKYFNSVSFPFAAGLMLIGGLCAFIGRIRDNRLLGLTGGVILAAFASVAAARALKPNMSLYAAFLATPILFSFAGALHRVIKARSGTVLGAHLVHLGAVVLLTGVLASSVFQARADLLYVYPDDLGSMADIGGGYSIKLEDIQVRQESPGKWVQDAAVMVYRDGEKMGTLTERVIDDPKFGRYTKLSIHRGFSADVYPIFQGLTGHPQGQMAIPLQVKVLPFVSLVWSGAILALVGMLLVIYFDYHR